MVNYNLPKFKPFELKTKKVTSNKLFDVLTVSIVVSFFTAILVTSIFYQQSGRNLAQLSGSSYREKNTTPVSQEETIVRIVDETSPAVVSVVVTKDIPVYVQDNSWGFLPSYRQDGTQEKKVGGGTGFIISKDGIVLTNKHVVIDDNARYTVLMLDGSEYSAKVLAKDPVQDIAFLQIETDGSNKFPTVRLANSDRIRVGQTVIAIGNALGQYQNTVSVGIVSGLGRTINASGGDFYETLKGVIQSDTAINKGNSGGPLLNLKGEVIGINTAIDIGGQNIAFSIPINKAKKDVEQIKKTGEIIYPFLGVRYIGINDIIKKQKDLTVNYGALVAKGKNGEGAILPGSAADNAGIKEGDIILELGGNKITTDNDLGEEIIKHSPGDRVAVKILRGTKEIDLNIILDTRNIQ